MLKYEQITRARTFGLLGMPRLAEPGSGLGSWVEDVLLRPNLYMFGLNFE